MSDEEDIEDQSWEAPVGKGFWYRCYNVAAEKKNKRNYWIFGRYGVVDKIVAKNESDAMRQIDKKIKTGKYTHSDCDAQEKAIEFGERVVLTAEDIELKRKLKRLRDRLLL